MKRLLTLGVILIVSLSIGSEDECCKQKTVGEHLYHYVGWDDTSQYDCHSNCVYSRDGKPGKRFCFKSGKEKSVCHNEGCLAKEVKRRGMSSGLHNASSWEKCGNICYQEKETTCQAGWTWIPATDPKDSGACHLFSTSHSFAPALPGTVSGDRLCPVEYCDQAHFSSWWSVVSPCFKKRVQNDTIYNPKLCEAEPNSGMKARIDAAVEDLSDTVHNSIELSSLAAGMYEDVPKDYLEYCPGDFDSLIVYLKVVAAITPPFLINAPNYLGVPITTVLLCFLHTQKGRIFFGRPVINNHMRTIVNLYGDLLNSPDSLTVFNDLQYGWMSKCARKSLQMEQFVHKSTDPHWGFKSFNEFFTRNLMDIKKTRPCDNGPYVLTAIGDVALFHNQTNVKLDSELYLKNESYSLKQIFYDEIIAKDFVGGAILQVFFSAHKYHRYHSPAGGKIVYAKKVPGIIYAIDEVNAVADTKFTFPPGTNFTAQQKLKKWLDVGQNGVINTELYLAHVATRCIFVIESPTLGQVGLVLIGMTEISSCTLGKQIGDSVQKGEEMGSFQFGGSSGLVALQDNIVKEAAKGPDIWSHNEKLSWKMCEQIVDLSPYD